MRIRGPNSASQTFFLTFSFFKASLVVKGCQWQSCFDHFFGVER